MRRLWRVIREWHDRLDAWAEPNIDLKDGREMLHEEPPPRKKTLSDHFREKGIKADGS